MVGGSACGWVVGRLAMVVGGCVGCGGSVVGCVFFFFFFFFSILVVVG